MSAGLIEVTGNIIVHHPARNISSIDERQDAVEQVSIEQEATK